MSAAQKILTRSLQTVSGETFTVEIDNRRRRLTNLGLRNCSRCDRQFVRTEMNYVLCPICFVTDDLPAGDTFASNEFANSVRNKYNELGLQDEVLPTVTESGVNEADQDIIRLVVTGETYD